MIMIDHYFKITNINETHFDHFYKDGLNILDKPFEEKGSCVKGGLYFTDKENIHKFYSYGILREIILPTKNPNFKMIKDPSGDKYRANMIYLGKKYSLMDPETYDIFNLIPDYRYIIKIVATLGDVKNLEKWKNKNINLNYFDEIPQIASSIGNIEILEWFKKSYLHLKIRYKNPFPAAFIREYIHVLDWLTKSDLTYKCTKKCHYNSLCK